jgi:hypothetical protein
VKQRRLEPKVLLKGKAFEKKEKDEWNATRQELVFESLVRGPKGKRGRMDIYVPKAGESLVSIAEIKATNWDKIPNTRIRQNVLRHATQMWRYVESEIERGIDVSPGLIYPRAPRNKAVKDLVESLLNERLIQCVWRKD